RGGVDQRDAGATALHGVAGDRQGAQGHAVEGVGEVDDRLTAGDLAGQLQGDLDRIVAGRAGEDHAVVELARLQDLGLEGLQEGATHVGEHVQAVDDAVIGEVLDDRLLQLRVVVTVVQRTCAGEEVEVLATVLSGHDAALGAGERGPPAAGAGADVRVRVGGAEGRGSPADPRRGGGAWGENRGGGERGPGGGQGAPPSGRVGVGAGD